MKKKFIASALVFTMVLSVLTGCTLFERNNERDMNQIVAQVNPITIEYTPLDAAGNKQFDDEGRVVTDSHVSEVYRITKRQLINAFMNANGSQQVADVQAALEETLENMITRQLLVEYSTAMMKQGSLIVFNRGNDMENRYFDIADSKTDMNIIWRNVYSVINNQIFLVGNEILTERGLPERERGEFAAVEPEFATQTDLDIIVDYVVEDLEFWVPSEVSYPGAKDFLYQEATARFLRNIISIVENDSTITRAERDKLRADRALLAEIQARPNGRVELYGELRNFYAVEKLIYKDQFESQIISRLQQMITEDVSITNEEIVRRFLDLQEAQISNFANSISEYESALDGGQPVLYHPAEASGYYFVKHILVPFSDEQTARIEQFNKLNEGKADIIRENRRAEAERITGFARVDGNNNGEPMTIQAIYNDIKSSVGNIGVHRDKERMFDRLVYRYNTDPGMFGNNTGYLIKPEGNSFVPEFQTAAEKLYENRELGAVSEMVVTDFGVHIMYLSQIMSPGRTDLYDFETPAEYASRSMYQIIDATLRTEATNRSFTVFVNQFVALHLNSDNNYVEIFSDRFSDLG